MKKNKIIFWVSTILIALFFGPGAVFNAIGSTDSVALFTKLGYPLYFMSYLGVLKVLGTIALLIPGYYRIKEWVYAGFVFDLVSAAFSIFMVSDNVMEWAFMPLPLAILFCSYIYYHKVYNPALNGSHAKA